MYEKKGKGNKATIRLRVYMARSRKRETRLDIPFKRNKCPIKFTVYI